MSIDYLEYARLWTDDRDAIRVVMILTLQVLLVLVVELSDLSWCAQSFYMVQYYIVVSIRQAAR